MTVEQGMDTGRGREIAAQLRLQSGVVSDISTQGTAMMQLLEEVWSGPDAQEYGNRWTSARPQLDRVGQMLDDMGAELMRQAEDQDRASTQAGGGPDGGPRGPQLPTLPPMPSLPSLPDIFDGVFELGKGLLEGLLGGLRSLYSTAAQLFVSGLDFLRDTTKFLSKFRGLGALLKGLGKGLPFLGSFLSGLDIGEALHRLTRDGGWKDPDAWLQLAQGGTGAIAGVLGAAALVASGTIVGLPAGAVLGGAALVFGGVSLGIGIYREFDSEINSAVKWAWDKGILGGPFNPNFPRLPLPSFPPSLPGWPGLPKPHLPNLPFPGLPGIPSLPGIPKLPSLPSIPKLPSLPKPSLPDINIPGL